MLIDSVDNRPTTSTSAVAGLTHVTEAVLPIFFIKLVASPPEIAVAIAVSV